MVSWARESKLQSLLSPSYLIVLLTEPTQCTFLAESVVQAEGSNKEANFLENNLFNTLSTTLFYQRDI